jgi:hypothetical protein
MKHIVMKKIYDQRKIPISCNIPNCLHNLVNNIKSYLHLPQKQKWYIIIEGQNKIENHFIQPWENLPQKKWITNQSVFRGDDVYVHLNQNIVQ